MGTAEIVKLLIPEYYRRNCWMFLERVMNEFTFYEILW